MVDRPYSKEELRKIMRRFCADKKRGISIEHFCEIAGVDVRDFRKAFLEDSINISEGMQIRVSKAYRSFERGDLVVYERWNKTRFVGYRQEPKPAFKKNIGFTLTKDGVKLNVGVVNRRDYTQPTFLEHLENLPGRKTWS
ncbi:MAG: hypothetical protein EBS53_07685 [Bacteroidetes bacterium]|nr:hypothetical protein [Bacteroidota bacterium]